MSTDMVSVVVDVLVCLVGIILGIALLGGAFVAMSKDDSSPNPNPNPNGYVVYRQTHGYGTRPNPTDMHTNVSANLYNFPNSPNGPKH